MVQKYNLRSRLSKKVYTINVNIENNNPQFILRLLQAASPHEIQITKRKKPSPFKLLSIEEAVHTAVNYRFKYRAGGTYCLHYIWKPTGFVFLGQPFYLLHGDPEYNCTFIKLAQDTTVEGLKEIFGCVKMSKYKDPYVIGVYRFVKTSRGYELQKRSKIWTNIEIII